MVGSYRSACNQDVVRELCDQLLQNESLNFDESTVKRRLSCSKGSCHMNNISSCLSFVGAVYRYYESRRKGYNDSQPQRQAVAEENRRRSRKSQDRRRVRFFLDIRFFFFCVCIIVV